METNLILIASISLIGVLVLMMIGLPLYAVIGALGVIGAYLAWGVPGISKLGLVVFQQFFDLQWTPMPLFVFLACVLSETTIGEEVFEAGSKWLSRLPGGLIVASIFAEAGLAACIGSSTTCTLTVGKVAVPQMEKLGYNKAFGVSALLIGGVLGPLIPPSIPMIVYAMMARQSISDLFIAGIIPGLLLITMLSIYAIVAVTLKPQLAPSKPGGSWKEKIFSLRKIWPVVILMAFILGGVYLGIMTPTEAAGVGSFVILIIAIVFYKFRMANFIRAIKEAAVCNGMIGLMMVGVMLFTYVVATSGLPQMMAKSLLGMGMSPWVIIAMINLILLFLGCFVDTLTIILLTLPFFVPLVSGLGFDLIWFGVLMTVNTEIGLITPPMGLNLFVAKSVFNLPIGNLIRAATPWMIVLITFLFILVAFPSISLWLPSMMFKGV
jgi:C4-dicarboxylate transporter, DctM subunit